MKLEEVLAFCGKAETLQSANSSGWIVNEVYHHSGTPLTSC